jgi:hypothetical protein
MESTTAELTMRIGVFSSLEAADKAVHGLLEAGFTRSEISVICSDATWQRHFREFEHQQPAGKNTPLAATLGGAIGAALGGLTAVAAGAATGGLALVAAGGAAAWTGGILGGFLGAMMTRGVERELADFYDQAVRKGKILVAAEAHGPRAPAQLARASEILAQAGAEPMPLQES